MKLTQLLNNLTKVDNISVEQAMSHLKSKKSILVNYKNYLFTIRLQNNILFTLDLANINSNVSLVMDTAANYSDTLFKNLFHIQIGNTTEVYIDKNNIIDTLSIQHPNMNFVINELKKGKSYIKFTYNK